MEPLKPVADPWERVGRPGRISLGMLRQALERAPNWYALHDKLALNLWGYGLDTETGLLFGESSDDLAGISYLSFVYPFKWGSLALFRHQLANFEAESQVVGLFGTDLPGFPGLTRSDDVRTRTDRV